MKDLPNIIKIRRKMGCRRIDKAQSRTSRAKNGTRTRNQPVLDIKNKSSRNKEKKSEKLSETHRPRQIKRQTVKIERSQNQINTS